MANTVIKVENISKCYQIGANKSLSLRESVTHIFKKSTTAISDYWALKDVEFEVKQGDTLAIIGKNGAGKSTLLKVLSKITTPTTGRIEINGRVASLLEVGTGFHPELSGRENIFLNGTILGMTKREIKSKFDEIVDFSGIETFIDTPVKRYSSGMYVRLAFAVAAHLEPEILIIDEVLAVGDAEFQRKCLGKMSTVASEGRTVLFVSHNLLQVQNLCKSGLLLDKGIVKFSGDINKTISEYVHTGGSTANYVDLTTIPCANQKNEGFDFKWLKLIDLKDACIEEGQELTIDIAFEARDFFKEMLVGITISDENFTLIECRSTASLKDFNINEIGELVVRVKFVVNLMAGTYNINLGARATKGLLQYIPSVSKLEVLPKKSLIVVEEWKRPSAGLLVVESSWNLMESKKI
jgi:lipopolysaccharide transport system ATP-binding protein